MQQRQFIDNFAECFQILCRKLKSKWIRGFHKGRPQSGGGGGGCPVRTIFGQGGRGSTDVDVRTF